MAPVTLDDLRRVLAAGETGAGGGVEIADLRGTTSCHLARSERPDEDVEVHFF